MYVAGTPPQDPAMLPGFLLSELRKLQEAMSTDANMLLLETLYVAPTKPREGMLVKADGTSWNPGSGAGFYGYRGGAWRKLD